MLSEKEIFDLAVKVADVPAPHTRGEFESRVKQIAEILRVELAKHEKAKDPA